MFCFGLCLVLEGGRLHFPLWKGGNSLLQQNLCMHFGVCMHLPWIPITSSVLILEYKSLNMYTCLYAQNEHIIAMTD